MSPAPESAAAAAGGAELGGSDGLSAFDSGLVKDEGGGGEASVEAEVEVGAAELGDSVAIEDRKKKKKKKQQRRGEEDI